MSPMGENLSAAWSVLAARPPTTATAYRTQALSVEVNGSAVLASTRMADATCSSRYPETPACGRGWTVRD